MNDEIENYVRKTLPLVSGELFNKISKAAIVKEFDAETEILREGQYVKVIPLVVEGLLKVSTRYKEKELLIYYIKPGESCVMTFSAGLKNLPSKIFAKTEEKSKILLLPINEVVGWTREFPDINSLFFTQYNQRYSELLDTINHLIYDKLDQRLFNFLSEKSKLTNKNPLSISHRQIAQELGTAREVISRVMKKLEQDNLVRQEGNSIKILEL